MFLDGQKLRPYIPMAKARGFTGAVDKVSIIGGNGSEVGAVSQNVPLVMAKTFQTVKEATGVDLAEIVRGESYDAKTTRNVNVRGADGKEMETAAISKSMKK